MQNLRPSRPEDFDSQIASKFAITIHSSVEIDQVLKDQFTPGISVRLYKQSTFRKPAKFDW